MARTGSGRWYPDEYVSYSDWLSDDNYVGPTNQLATTGKVKSKKKPKKKSEPKPQAPPPPTYTPTPSPVSRYGNYAPIQAPQAAPAPTYNPPPPAPVINFTMPEAPYQPSVYNRQTAVNNRSLKIDSSYEKPKNRGGTSGFKRSKTPRQYGTNAAMRINKSLSV
tara:strand:- start:27 stop:518 length:492 start_codon:yes stop_codon:yes gene_type:complete